MKSIKNIHNIHNNYYTYINIKELHILDKIDMQANVGIIINTVLDIPADRSIKHTIITRRPNITSFIWFAIVV